MSEKQARTLTERWEAFVHAEDDYIGGGVPIDRPLLTDMVAIFRRQAHNIYLSRVRAGIWNQQEALSAWDYYLAHDRALV